MGVERRQPKQTPTMRRTRLARFNSLHKAWEDADWAHTLLRRERDKHSRSGRVETPLELARVGVVIMLNAEITTANQVRDDAMGALEDYVDSLLHRLEELNR